MAQKKSRNPKAQPAATPQPDKAAKPAPSRKKLSLAHWLLLALGFGLYLNTVTYEFALDDKLYITYNQFTKKGVAGIPDLWKNELLTGFYGTKRNLLSGGRYRPMSLTTHAIEWSLLGPDEEAEKAKRARGQWTAEDDAHKKAKLDSLANVGHFLNAVIYGLTGLVLYIVLCYLFPPDPKKKWYLTFPFIATALYIAHPLHTEVVANIKSRDELMSVLGALGALYYTLKHLRNQKYQPLFMAGGCMLFSLFSKESAVTFLGIIPLTAFFFTKAKPGRVVLSTLILIGISLIWLVTRFEVIGWDQPQPIAELMNDPFLGQSQGDKFATIFYTMGLYIKLLVFPHPLTHDYYPYHIPIISWSDPRAYGSLLLYVALIAVALWGLRKKSMYSYGILLYLGSFILFSNLVFGIGAFMNERFMYIPSLGFGAIFAYFLTNTVPCRLKNAARYERTFLPLIFATVLVLYSAKTITRNAAWENDEILALTDAKVSVNSAKVNMSAGSALLTLGQQTSDPIQKRKYFEQGVGHLEHSVSIYPTYVQSLHLLGTTHLELQDYERALHYYDIVMRVNPDFGDTKRNLEVMGNLCTQRKAFQAAISAYNKLLQYHPGMVRIWAALGEVYGKHLQDYPKSLEYLRKAEQLDPNDSDVLQKIGVVYAMTGQSQSALDVFLRALEVSPNNPSIMMNVGVVYRNLGQEELGLQYLNEAFRLKPELRQSFQQ